MEFTKMGLIILNIIILLIAIFGLFKVKITTLLCLQSLVFILIYGFRDSKVGVDTKNYIIQYNTGTGGYFEIGFRKIGYLLYQFQFTERYYLLVIVFIQIFFIYVFIMSISIKDKLKPFLMWLFLTNTTVVFNSINGLRQGIAATLILLISIVGVKRKKIKFIKFFSYTIHKSSIIFIFLDLWKKIKDKYFYSMKKIMGLYLILLLLGISIEDIILRMSLFPDRYITTGSKILLYKLFFYIGCMYIFHFLRDRERISEKKMEIKIFLNNYSFIIGIVLISYGINEVANRYFYYMGYYIPILLIYLVEYFDRKNNKILLLVVLLNFMSYIILVNTNQYAIMFNY